MPSSRHATRIDSLPALRRTDAHFLREGARSTIEVLDEAVVVRTPDNPGFQTGNALWFAAAPRPDDADRWPSLFSRAFFGTKLRHVCLGWDGEGASEETLERFSRLGFKYERTVCLALERGRLAKPGSGGVEIARARGDADWALMTRLQEEAAKRWYSRTRLFSKKLVLACRRMSERGLGDWYLARLDGKPAGKLGLHHDGRDGRFHNIDTVPALRRRGVATELISAALAHAFGELRLERVYMAADPDGEAIRIYRRFGFTPAHESHELIRKD